MSSASKLTVPPPPTDDRNLASWQCYIAAAAENGDGLNAFKAGLEAAEKNMPPDHPFYETAKHGLWDAAKRHLADAHGVDALEKSYFCVFSEYPKRDPNTLAGNSELDEETIKIDNDVAVDIEIEWLSKLSPMEYQRERKFSAKKLGVTVAALDQIVADRRKRREEASQPSLYPHWDVEPYPEPVDSERLLWALIKCIRKYVMLTQDQAVAVALWVMFSWVHERAAVHSPLLIVTSPQPNCGKSTLLGVIGFLVRRSLVSVSISGAALFRSIEKWLPTFVVDEADTRLVNNDDLKEVVNSGWTRGQSVIRCDPDTNEPRSFPTFAPKAIGMKGRNLPDTTLSRAIIIEMQAKLPDEQVKDFDHVDDEDLAVLRRKLLRWANDNGERLAFATSAVPDGFHNRVRANWKLLLAIAELAGSTSKASAHKAAIAIEKIKATFETSLGVELLHDINAAFDATRQDAIFTKTLIDNLIADEERPWAAYGRARKPITDRQIAKLLEEFKIFSRTVRIGTTAKGYKKADFAEACRRYPKTKRVPHPPESDPQTSQRHNADETGTSDDFSSVTQSECDGYEKCDLSNNHGHCDAVTDENQNSWEMEI